MTESLNLRVLAEYVETKEQRDMLAKLGCSPLSGLVLQQAAALSGI